MLASEYPACFREAEVAQDELDDGFKTFEGADQIRAVRPWAAEVDVKSIAVGFGGESGVGGGGDEGAELAGLAPEVAVCVGVFVDWGLDGKGGEISWD